MSDPRTEAGTVPQTAGTVPHADRRPDPRIIPTDSAPAVAEPEVFDPLRLCIFATVALLGWWLGPIALVFFAALGVTGYAKARRAGLMTSKCLLGDTRMVLAYLGLLVVLGAAALVIGFGPWRLW